MLITHLLKWLSKADEDFHPEVRREFCVNSAENMIAVTEGGYGRAEQLKKETMKKAAAIQAGR